MRLIIVSFFCVCLLLLGCGDSSSRRSIAQNYELEFVGGNSVLHVAGNTRLYYLTPSKKSIRIWSYVVGRTPISIDDLIVFNAGLSDDKRWGVYHALLACEGSGPAVEISKSISRKAGEGVDYSFRLVTSTNNNLQLSGRQLSPVDAGKPLNIDIELSKDEVLRAMEETKRRGEKRRYEGVDYFIEP